MPPPLRLRGLHLRVRLRDRAEAVPPELRVRAPQELQEQLPSPDGEEQDCVVPDQEGVERGVPGLDGLREFVAVFVAGCGEVSGGGFLRRRQGDGGWVLSEDVKVLIFLWFFFFVCFAFALGAVDDLDVPLFVLISL